MTVFESINSNSNKAAKLGEDYLKNSQKYIKLKVFEQLTISLSLIGKMVIIGSLLFIAFLFIAVSIAIALGYLINNMALGCLIVGVLFLILAFTAYKLRSKINKMIIQKMSPKFFN